MKRLVILRSIIWSKWMFLDKKIHFCKTRHRLISLIKRNLISLHLNLIFKKKSEAPTNGKLQDKDQLIKIPEEMHTMTLNFQDKSLTWLEGMIITCHLVDQLSITNSTTTEEVREMRISILMIQILNREILEI